MSVALYRLSTFVAVLFALFADDYNTKILVLIIVILMGVDALVDKANG